MHKTIAAVIVTYNRTDLLVRCLESLLVQSHPVDRIILVDNNPDNAISNYLKSRGYLKPDHFDYLSPTENIGGAGGFHLGMKHAFEQNFDWIWLIDDDGFLEHDCLEHLLAAKTEYDVIGPVVCDPENPDQLTWGYRRLTPEGFFAPRGHIQSREALSKAATQGYYDGYTNFFNGVLFSYETLKQVGLPLKEMFCWGDEVEYFMRCKQANLRICTAIHAVCYHPSPLESMTPFKFYHRLRNTCYTSQKYKDVIYSPAVRHLYPFYILAKSLLKLPSYSPTYLRQLNRGIVGAFRSQLIPFEVSK